MTIEETPATTPTVAITGAAGFAGSCVIQAFQNKHPDWNLIGIDNFYLGTVRTVGDLSIKHVDIRDRRRLASAISDADVVVHLAAISGVPDCTENPDLTYETNVVGTANVTNWCRKTGAGLVFPLSMAIVGDPQEFPISIDHPREPMNWYGRTKVLGERIVESFAADAFPAHLFLKGNLYGIHRAGGQTVTRNNVINYFVERALAGEDLTVYKPGTQARNYVHVVDVAQAYVQSVEAVLDQRDRGETGIEKFEIAGRKAPSVLDIAEFIQEVATERSMDVRVRQVENPRTETLVSNFDVDISKAQSELNWEPERGIESSIREAFDLLSKTNN